MASRNISFPSTSLSTGRVARGSVHTPLSPASVQDLKAKFDSAKAGTSNSKGSSTSTTTAHKNSCLKTDNPLSEKKAPAGSSQNKVVTSFPSSNKSSSSTTLSSVSSSLQAAAQRKLNSASAVSSISSLSSSSTLNPVSKSPVSSTTSKPFSSSLSSSSSKHASTTESRSQTTTSTSLSSSKIEPKSGTSRAPFSKTASGTTLTNSSTNSRQSSSDLKHCFDRDKLGLAELPVMDISPSGSVTVQIRAKSSVVNSRPEVPSVTEMKSSRDSKLEVTNVTGTKSSVRDSKLEVTSVTGAKSSVRDGKKEVTSVTGTKSSVRDGKLEVTSVTGVKSTGENSKSVVTADIRVKSSAVNSKSDIIAVTRPRSSTFDNKLESVAVNRSRISSMESKSRENNDKKTQIESNLVGKKSSDSNTTKSARPSSRIENEFLKENGSSVKSSDKKVTKDTKEEWLDSGGGVTSKKSINTSITTTTNSPTKITGNASWIKNDAKLGKLTTERSSISPEKAENSKPEFSQVKLRKTRLENHESAIKPTSSRGNSKTGNSDVEEEKRASRKISNERFERLMFDFQRGVPTETIPRRGSETDHVALQEKARQLSAPATQDDVPVIAKKKKESSILTEGLKVSDFVKQVNKMNPESEARPKWKAQTYQSQTSSEVSSDVGGDNFYQGIAGDEAGNSSDDNDDIYEKVTNKAASSPDGDLEGDSTRAPGRRLGVYRKQRGSKKKGDENKPTREQTVNDSDDRLAQSEKACNNNGDSSSSGTDYEDVSTDGNEVTVESGLCLYEDLENFTKPTGQPVKNKTIKNKLKKIFYKSGSKNKKNKSFIDSGVSAGTESEADTVDDTEDADSDMTETFSRSGSERSNGRQGRDSAALNSMSTCSLSTQSGASNPEEVFITESARSQPQAPMETGPPLPPRTSKVLNQPNEDSPPLPPRNTTAPGNKMAPGSKTSPGNSKDTAPPTSPADSRKGHVSNKTKDKLSQGGTTQDRTDSGVLGSRKSGITGQDPSSPSQFEKPEKVDRKTGSTSQSASDTPPASPAPAYVYPDISAFPELKGDNDLYVDLEDEQIYGKSSDLYNSKLMLNEPLYQWYSKNKVIQNMSSDKSTSDDLSSDDDYLEERKRRPESLYEDVEKLLEKANINISMAKTGTSRGNKTVGYRGSANLEVISAKDKPQRRSIIEDVFKNGGSLHRALWCQMPEVVESGILPKLTDQQKKIQEAMFEIITSEASYLKSLKVLISVFLMAPEFSSEMSDKCVVSRRERQILFSNIGHIKDISEDFLKELEDRWQESCYIKDVCDIIHKHASLKFEPYIRYCGNQSFQDKVLNLLRQNSEFNEAVRRLELHPDCQYLPLPSFLLLPMQRITRLPLLVDAISHRLEPGTPAHDSAKQAMDSLTKVAKKCDEAAKKMQQTEQICRLKSNLEFKIKEFPLISASRHLVKQGELTQIKVEGAGRKPLSKLLGSNKEHVYLFLFTDVLLVTKKKGSTFQVRDYCQRNALHMECVDNPDKTSHIVPGTATGVPNILFLAMLSNHENKQVEMVLSCKSESERTRWIDAIMPQNASSESERVYDLWGTVHFCRLFTQHS